ncbi:MAG: Bifunctional protein FolD [Candidatus Curtissbacteria bacterium GW2011_GWA1_40_16]|uniref:Bifunctional protein FolD n=1 Tax=Candidatus Curtissbacteria bacterium GW2011_GWA1_40_16 TaxID=1618405 RepID=A0A0G0REV7_9BACT|nr:MAG: Bifunctional protein FolD [Candidatus Curtissbacteria bacterium GW2011_GWA1_40_16]
MAQILDGRVVRDQIEKRLKSEIETLRAGGPQGRRPKLVIIQVGDNPESNTYIGQKIKFGEKIGAIVELKKFTTDVTQEILKSYIVNLNSDQNIHGIIIQLPIPEHLDKDALIELIDPKKDIDGLTTTNQKLLEENSPNAIIPATAKGVISMLNFYKIPVKNKKVTVVGRSKLVGTPAIVKRRI